ncbi:MAG: aldehyde dehydrogenase family protein, partial [Candidatus Sumerlaeota bacterium]
MKYQTINPSNGELLKSYTPATGREIEAMLVRAEKSFVAFRQLPLKARMDLLERAADVLEQKSVELAGLMALEMGKPLKQGEAEAKKCATACRYFARHAAEFLGNEQFKTDASEAFVAFEPIGTILAIMPWNFPFWQFFRFAAPTLALGNTILLKHAPNTPQCSLAISDVMLEAGFAPGVVQSIFLTNGNVSKVLQDYRISGVTLTGSSEAGSKVASDAGKNLKRMVLELGGSDPFIVLEDADLKETARVAAQARCQNSGQSCIAAKRFLVQRGIEKEFTDLFIAEMTAMKVGDPLDDDTIIGPLARKDLRAHLQRQVNDSLKAGAHRLVGGKIPEGKGYFYPPTVLSNIVQGTAAWKDELFGPVAAIIAFGT